MINYVIKNIVTYPVIVDGDNGQQGLGPDKLMTISESTLSSPRNKELISMGMLNVIDKIESKIKKISKEE
jgi:hypothetical protein